MAPEEAPPLRSVDNTKRDDSEVEEGRETTPLLTSNQRTSSSSPTANKSNDSVTTGSGSKINATPSESAEHREDDWASPENEQNPRNWSLAYKWMTVILVSFVEFLTMMPNFMYAPNIADAQRELGSTDDTLATFSLTIYLLGFTLGPLLFAPLSEVYGRAIIYRICLALYLVFTAGCAVARSMEWLIVARFLCGSLAAAPVAVGGAVVADVFAAGERGAAMSVYNAGLIISAVVGPPIGGLIGWTLHWRWVFWIVCIMTAAAWLCVLLVLSETHAPTLRNEIYGVDMDAIEHGAKTSLVTEVKKALSRPFKLLTQSPTTVCCCLLIFVIMGALNVFLSYMSRIYQEEYGMTSGQSANVYFGLATGFVIASIAFGTTNDRIMHALARRNKGEIQPEFRLPAAMIAMPVTAIGTLLYGWFLEYKLPWIMPILGSGVAGIGITTVQLSITTYTTDSVEKFSASALAAITMARSIGGSLIPLLAPILYQRLGKGWGSSVFAGIDLICGVVPIVLYIYGARWRAMLSTDGW